MAPILTVHVKEITKALPHMLRVAVRDQEPVKFPPVQGSVEAGAYRSTVTRTNPFTGLSQSATITGRNNDYLKFFDLKPTVFADRVAMDNPANYPVIGGRTVTNVYRLTMPYEEARFGSGQNHAVMEHKLYLEFDGDLPDGDYTLSIVGNTFPATQFTLDDKFTRGCAISSTQLGHRPGDGFKKAYMQIWLPNGPNEGDVDLVGDHGVSEFHIINTRREIVFTGTVEQIATPSTSEPTYVNTYFPSMNTAPQTATAANSATDTITKSGHGYSTGQIKLFRGFAGTNLEGVPWYVTVVDTNNFTVQGFDVNTNLPTGVGFTGTWVPNTYIAAHDGKIYDTVLRNRYATHVFGLDYSAFVPNDPAERYKVWVPGFGVSDEFMIHDAIYFKYAKNAMKGLYHQCIGIPLDADVGGWDRSVWGRDGVNGCQVFESMLPGNMHYENVFASPVPLSTDTYTPWITSTRVVGFFGLLGDAGDHDFHVQRHLPRATIMLDMAYERMPSAVRDLQFGFPKASTTWDYTTMYDDIDAMGDIVHIVLHFIEPLRRTQKIDGRVYAGMNYSNPLAEISDGKAGSSVDPSWLSPHNPHLLAADHYSNFCYAALAAKLGKIFQAAGHTTLGQTWIDSAALAFQWAETIYQGYKAKRDLSLPGIDATAWIDYYVNILDIKTRSGFSDAQLIANFDQVQDGLAGVRLHAVACLYAAYTAQSPDTGSAPYWAILLPLEDDAPQDYPIWEYAQGPAGDAGFKAFYNGRWHISPENVYAHFFANTAIYRCSGNGVNPWPSAPNEKLAYAFLTAETRSPTPQAKDNTNPFIKILQGGENFVTGANPYGLSCVTGIGVRGPHTLINDRIAMGIPPEDILGFPCYMGAGSWATANILNNLSTDVANNFTSSLTAAGDANAATGGAKKLVEPYHNMVPHGLIHFENTLAIYPTETDLASPICGRMANSAFLHLWDGNTVTWQPKTRFYARCI